MVMKGQAILGIIVFALVSVGVVLLVFTQLKPPELTPIEYINYLNKVFQGQPPEEVEVTPSAQEVTQNILEHFGVPEGEGADLVTEPGYIISYTPPTPSAPWPDYWIEITATTPETIAAAKQAAEKWLLEQGYSEDDLCSGGIPVHFYLSEEASKALAESGKEAGISPYPDFCK